MGTLGELKDELFHCCKVGDVDRLRYLVSELGLNVNLHDEWQASPLYYASLCGHYDAVVFLLNAGARCQESTFDGERCVYAALNDRIRHVLRQFKTVRARDPWSVFLRRCFQEPERNFSDVIFLVHGESVHAHRVLLGSRCAYFHEMFRGRWAGRRVITLSHGRLTPNAFRAFLRFLYTERLEVHVADVNSFLDLCKQCRTPHLADLVGELTARAGAAELLLHDEGGDNWAVAQDLAAVASDCIDYAAAHATALDPPRHHVFREGVPAALDYPDVCFEVQGRLFPCHQVLMRGRSEYINALFSGAFQDCTAPATQEQNSVPVVSLADCDAEIFALVLEFLYANRCSLAPGDAFYQLFQQADVFLIPELKNYCVQQAQKFLSDDNVLEVYKFAQLVGSFRLEDECIAYMSKHLLTVGTTEEFRELVVDSCRTIKARQEVDTCPLIDDIRSHLITDLPEEGEGPASGKVLWLTANPDFLLDTHRKLALLEDVLQELNLEL
eukprot:EG_transcript_7301